MYFPYFRGRQYEMLALKELAAEGLLGKSIIPIVEPVKLMSTFDTTLRVYAQKQFRIALIFNPAVGDFAGDTNFVEEYAKRFGTVKGVIPALLMNEGADDTISALTAKGIAISDIVTILNNRDFIGGYKAAFASAVPSYTLLPDEREFRRAANIPKVTFKDNFEKKARNADYPEDSFFTDDHLFFAEDDYSGFGDYSIVGSEFTEGGFAPRVVTIHIAYFDVDNTMRVRHFSSYSNNEDISDVAGKFHEAVTLLAEWYCKGQQHQNTYALSVLLKHANDGYYPGLPTIKKLSIMHHLELVGKFLDGGMKK